ncbi:MAG: UDP-N-acetylglucosamine 2-epimerase [Candidatus Entotheonella factor]|uniref:UDP-N-acetylglucosamine 2-epimerase n=1 Tax=Entotheonella factor TaxID=1429438 RepID=W4LD60_ENTF1|nr:MAG: UDP-N-acetylglucosamine 2-epimerase [Candidatus Entotheonella factor]
MNILHVVGARPNFMKVAPVMAALDSREACSQRLVHTGQHYDANMSDVFFQQLGLPQPDVSLGVGSGSHAVQTAQIMMRFEEVVEEQRPGLVLVYGDVNSTVAAALVCAKLLIPVGHVEAGLRSYDRTMPEEINRLMTDQTADLLFTPSPDGDANLLREGIAPDAIHHVGNVMIDTLVRLLPQAQLPHIDGLATRYALVTLHRPSNVDDEAMLRRLMTTLQEVSQELQVVFPIHPRTRARLQAFDLAVVDEERFLLLEPLGYLEFLALQRQATLVITDSGGVQEESTYLRVPCLTARENTERPITVDVGTNVLVGQDMERLRAEVDHILAGTFKTGEIPRLWDGRAGERIADVIETWQG